LNEPQEFPVNNLACAPLNIPLPVPLYGLVARLLRSTFAAVLLVVLAALVLGDLINVIRELL